MTDKEGKADAQPFHLILLATRPDRLPEPVPARHRRPHRRLLLQAAHRPRAPRQAQRGPDRPVGLPQRRGLAGARGRGLGPRPDRRRRVRATSSARAASSSSSRTTASPSSAGSTSSCCASRPSWTCRSSSRTTCTTSGASSTRPTTSCCASARPPTSTRPGRLKFETDDFFLKSAAEMAALFPDHLEAIRNTKRIAEMCDVELPLGQTRIPHFPVPDGETVESWLAQGVPARPRVALRDGHAGAPGSASTTSSASSPRWATPATS